VAEILDQQAGRHSVFVQRFAGHVANLFDPYLARLRRELKLVMMDAPETTQNLRVINRIVAEYKRAQISIYGDYNEEVLLKELRDFSVSEAEWEQSSLKSVITSSSVEVTLPADAQIWAAVTNNPLVFENSQDVKLLQPFIKDWEARQVEAVGNVIRTGFITGRTNQQITNDILNGGILDPNTKKNVSKDIKTMVRTSTNHTATLARESTLRENDDIVIGYKWISTLDGRTSTVCQSLDGTIFKFSDKKQNKIKPPAHPNCRSVTSPVLDERFNFDTSADKRGSVGVGGRGQVAADTDYYTWLRNQGAQGKKGQAFVKDILGNERGDLFLKGGLTNKQFKQLTIDELFRPIPLDELRKKKSLQLAFDAIDG